MTTLSLTEAKAKFNELVEKTLTTHERVTITRHGRPAVVLMSLEDLEDLEALEETLLWQEHSAVREDAVSAREEARVDKLHDEATVRRRYGVGTTR